MKLLIILAIAVVGGIILSAFIIMNDQTILQIPITAIASTTSYKYNTVCDLGEYEEFVKQKVLPVVFEIMGGKHNENERLAKFFKSNEFINSLNLNPDQIYGSNGNPNYDPIFYDAMFLMPVALDIMGASPELIKILSVHEGESQISYMNRLASEIDKCK